MQEAASQKDIIGTKIVKILFSPKPEKSIERQAPCLDWIGHPDEPENERKMYYTVNNGTVCLLLDNGLALEFGNSEWGGMTILPHQKFIEESKFEGYKEYSDKELEEE